ncbi:restriction endonuclease subunit S [Enterobacter hormaechei]|uniref:restriction endonuclease subunit S n=1 Tax=Enterobacter hormaechei TaxID=158836 RepID=UPI00298B5EE8|nr:restriction endonuclease subunit S [Enterobacter hormaechei]HBL5175750.1 restriction endonuclease subunit S [Enterobacter hormaechei]HBL6016124.1 restriction endonuclease subunit S [Enterobacter hormaechei]HBL6130670.1 restriction endonuclease subunit S [Enterobacter hormaechei]HBL8997552.1 restriction endonuclease subunit S [Enterobacter hormaechei]
MSGGKLPEGWVDTPLENIVEILDSMRIPVNNKERQKRIEGKDFNKLYPYYGATGEVGKIDDFIFDEELIALGEDGVSFFDGQKNKAYMLYGKAWVNNHAHVLKAIQGLSHNKFLCYFLNQFDYHDYVNGGTRLKLTQANMRKIPVRFAPFSEQKIIAEKLDTLLAQVDSTKARLEQIPQILKRFRQAVLIAAFTKKLTESSEFTEKKISDVCSFQNGFAFKSSWFSKTGSYQVIKLANIRDGYLFLENAPAYVNEEQGVEFSKFSPNIGDVLISMTGTRFKKDYGFGCIMTQKHKALINQRVGRLIPIKASILPEYLFLFVRSELFREQFFKGETGGVNQGNVGSQHIQSILINVPPLTEQHEIVRRVEQLFAYTDTIEKQVNNALALVNSLTQSLLAKAFRGELTAQWRAENPDLISGESSAAALLERIKAERAASGGKKNSRKKA